MHRTSILLPERLKKAAERVAEARGMSLGALIRQTLEQLVAGSAGKHASDPVFDDFQPYTGELPSDIADQHDRYLYDEP